MKENIIRFSFQYFVTYSELFRLLYVSNDISINHTFNFKSQNPSSLILIRLTVKNETRWNEMFWSIAFNNEIKFYPGSGFIHYLERTHITKLLIADQTDPLRNILDNFLVYQK